MCTIVPSTDEGTSKDTGLVRSRADPSIQASAIILRIFKDTLHQSTVSLPWNAPVPFTCPLGRKAEWALPSRPPGHPLPSPGILILASNTLLARQEAQLERLRDGEPQEGPCEGRLSTCYCTADAGSVPPPHSTADGKRTCSQEHFCPSPGHLVQTHKHRLNTLRTE